MHHLVNTTPPANPVRVLATKEAKEAWRENRQLMLSAVETFFARQYDWDGEGGLPAREDVISELRSRLLGPYGMDLRNLPRPEFELIADGTIEIAYEHGRRTVIIQILCWGVVGWWKSTDEGALIEGTIKLARGTPGTGYAHEIDEVTAWVLEED